MDISEIRLNNLNKVLDEHFQGVKAHLANAIGVSPNNFSRYSSTNPKHRRTISDDIAREIERVIDLPRGWMDVAHQELPEPQTRPVENGAEHKRYKVLLELGKLIELAELQAQVDLIRRRKNGGF
jgi:hypothetical protein